MMRDAVSALVAAGARLFEHGFDAVLLVDPELMIRYGNSAVPVLFGFRHDPAWLAGRPLAELGFSSLERLLGKCLADLPAGGLDTTLTLAVPGPAPARVFDVKIGRLDDDAFAPLLLVVTLREITAELERERRLVRSTEELSILFEISQVEAGSLDHEEILSRVLEKFSELTNLDRGLFLRLDARCRVTGFVAWNIDDALRQALAPILAGRRIPRRVAAATARIIQLGSRRRGVAGRLAALGIALVVTIPVPLAGGLYGVLLLLSPDSELLRISSNERFFRLVGQQVGAAIEKARLFGELEGSFRVIERKNRQLDEELALARKMQRGILSLAFPRKPGIGFAVKYIPSYHLSGDFYDIFELSENMVGVLIADVCGHGINAALVTAFLKASVRDMSQNFGKPHELLASLDARLHDLLASTMFVSAFYMIIDLEGRELLYANAGHPWPLFYSGQTGEIGELRAEGTLLAVHGDSEYSSKKAPFLDGDRVVLFTDGLFDVKNAAGEFYPGERVRSILCAHPRTGGSRLVDILIDDVRGFAGGMNFADDINLIVIDFGLAQDVG